MLSCLLVYIRMFTRTVSIANYAIIDFAIYLCSIFVTWKKKKNEISQIKMYRNINTVEGAILTESKKFQFIILQDDVIYFYNDEIFIKKSVL